MKNFFFKTLIIYIILCSNTIKCQISIYTCPNKICYFAYNLPIDGNKWYVPIKYEISGDLIDLKIKRKDKEELFIRFKIIKNLNCDFTDVNNCKLKYKILTYDEETNSYEKRESEIEFNFENGKGKIYIRHPNFPEIISDATSDFKKE